MNKIAVQSLLLGAQLMGLENVVVVQGDRFDGERPVAGQGRQRLQAYGAPGRDPGDEPGHRLQGPEAAVADRLLCRSVHRPRAGGREGGPSCQAQGGGGGAVLHLAADFRPGGPALELLDRYAEENGERLSAPVFFGVQVMTTGGPVFGDVPEWVTVGLSKGRSGTWT